MHRFQISPNSIKEGYAVLNAEESHHALSVLRVKPGETVQLLDGRGGSFQGIVATAEKGCVKIAVREPSQPLAQNSVAMTLAVSVIKPERMELLIQKACELGVHSIIPLITEHTVVRLSSERWASKIQRWKKIAAESCKQCGQPRTPEIQDICEFKKFIGYFSSYELVLIPALSVPVQSLYHSLNLNKSAQSTINPGG